MRISHKRFTKLSVLCIVLCTFVISACTPNSIAPDINNVPATNVSDFAKLMNDTFIDEVSSDLLTLNYTLAHPENYGITEYNTDYGELSLNSLGDDSEVIELLRTLKDFNYSELGEDEKLTYDILKKYLEIELEYSDLYLYPKTLSPTIGLSCQLPVVLAEYSFRKEQDVYDYLELISHTKEYFEYILQIEEMKSENGLFMMDEIADKIIDQCNSFIQNPDDNFLIGVFDEKIASMECFDNSKKNELSHQNKTLVKENVIKAYELLADGLTALKGTGKCDGGLCNYPQGDRFYEYLVKSDTGSNRSIEDIETLIDEYTLSALNSIATAMRLDYTIYETALDTHFDMTDPYEILEDLKERISSQFPELPDTTYTIKYVPESMGKYLSPAFYMSPAIDERYDNSIYINTYGRSDDDDIYTTLAHEGFPGHLYQAIYCNSKDLSPIRSILDYPGYMEGWATYVELLSYEFGALDKNVGKVLANNEMILLCFYAKCDIGVNYHGWNSDDIANYASGLLGQLSRDVIDDIYITMVAEPANYLKYVVGCLEFMELKNTAKEKLGDAFNPVDFHDFVLSIGPAPFDIINSRMDSWIFKQLNTLNK